MSVLHFMLVEPMIDVFWNVEATQVFQTDKENSEQFVKIIKESTLEF